MCPTSFWFIAERNTVTDEIMRTYPAGEVFKPPGRLRTPSETTR